MAIGMNRSILMWAESGAAKTSQLSYLSRRIWREHHKRTRVVSTDGGSLDPLKPEIEIGLIEPFVVPPIDGKTIALMRKLSTGFWPNMDKLKNEHKIVLQAPTNAMFKEFGLLSFDGLTSTSDRIFRDMQQSGLRLGKDDASAALEETVEFDAIAGQPIQQQKPEKIYAATQSMYMFTQKEVRMLVDNVSTLPFERTYWTALESKGEEVVGRDTIYGPMLVGSAATSKIPAWFGDCFHAEAMYSPKLDRERKQILDPITKAPILVKTIRVYFVDHQDPKTSFRYKAKPRTPPHLYHKLDEKYPGGYFDLTPDKGIDEFLDFEDSLFDQSGEDLKRLDFDLEKFRAEIGRDRPAQVAVPQIPASKPVVTLGTATKQ